MCDRDLLRTSSQKNSIRLTASKRDSPPHPVWTSRWKFRLRHSRHIKPASCSRWSDESRSPRLVETLFNLSGQEGIFIFPNSDSEDTDFVPSQRDRREDTVEPRDIIETNDFPEPASPIDLHALDLEAKSLSPEVRDQCEQQDDGTDD